MNETVLQFVRDNRLCVISIPLRDGTPHGSTTHFSHQDDPFKIYIGTDRTYKKCELLLDGTIVRGTVVVGVDEVAMKTLQMDGDVRIISSPEELVALKKIHYAKIPTSEKWDGDPDTVFLEFTPTWWRYSDFTTSPETRISSDTAA